MNILYLMNYAGAGGSEKYVKNMMTHAKSAGHNCFFAYNIDGELKTFADGVCEKVYQISMKSPFDYKSAQCVAVVCNQHHIDVIHVQFPRENCIALTSQIWYKKSRVVFTCHMLYEKNLLWRYLNRLFTPKNHAVIAVCEESAKMLAQNGVKRSQITVVPNGITAPQSVEKNNDVRHELGISDTDFVAVIVVRYDPVKGLGFLIDIMDKLRGKMKCIIVGDGKEYEKIHTLIEKKKLTGTVFQVGYRTDVDKFLSCADMALNTSKSEAASFAILEGMAYGLPTVATDVGGNRDILQSELPAGLVSKSGDVDGFCAAVEKIIANPDIHARYSSNARQNALGAFDLNNLLNKTLKIYEEKKDEIN